MAATLKWKVLTLPVGALDVTGSDVIADATTIISIVYLPNSGTVIVYYV